jgi:hypothetical protein
MEIQCRKESDRSGGRVNGIQIRDNFLPIRLRGKELVTFVDLGSNVTTLKECEKDRLELNVETGSFSTVGRVIEAIE